MTETAADPAVEATDLRRVFETRASSVTAVDGLDLRVRSGEIVGLLGPNGAGKTTTLRMLTTLLAPTSGEATVAGRDLRADPGDVRRHIGYVAQGGSTDPQLRGREELVQQCRIYGMARAAAGRRTADLCRQFELDELADRPLATLSGGQRRRVEIGLGLVHRPSVVFLDEPTLGLDPQNRAVIWDHVRRIRQADGVTVVLSTNHLDEADALCDRVLIVDRGRLVADGAPAALKRRVAGDVLTIEANDPEAARRAVAHAGGLPPVREVTVVDGTVRLAVDDGDSAIAPLLGALGAAGVEVLAARLRRPTLDDVFFDVTGRWVHDEAPAAGPGTTGSRSPEDAEVGPGGPPPDARRTGVAGSDAR